MASRRQCRTPHGWFWRAGVFALLMLMISGSPAIADQPAMRSTQGRAVELTVFSQAMAAPVPVMVLPRPDPSRPAPVLYLLNGIDGGTAGDGWTDRTDVDQFFADKQVTVVVPVGGAGSYFTDWRADDPVLGRQRWTTFLTRELPPLIDATFGGTGANAIAGVSMTGTSVFQLAMAAPGLYRAIGSYSGCVRTSDPAGQAVVAAIVTAEGGTVANMWGPLGDPAWAANDPYVHADRLRGTTIYVAAGNGQAGPRDEPDSAGIDGNPAKLVDQLVIGGVLEAVSDRCTRSLRDRFHELGVPATFDLRPNGTHSWGYWQQDLHNSWPLFASALR
ncbi:alpha/beta hydrolase [Nocardia gipuzkoensis]|uniref:alpha/beta hydrolase n=1 Tax=Nocardia gipuzkoensis TaxID=2749991 RepID=UPI003EE2246F